MKLLVKITSTGFIPAYNSDYEAKKAAKLKVGDLYEIDIKKKRNYEFHKKYFALLNLCFDNQEYFEEFDDLRDYLIVKSGYYRKVKMPNGFEQVKPKSISFSNMDDIEFDQLYQKTIDQIIKLLKITEGELLNELLNYM